MKGKEYNLIYKALFDSAEEPKIIIRVTDGTILKINRSALDLLEYDEKEIVGGSFLETVSSGDRSRLQQKLAKHTQNTQGIRETVSILNASDEFIPVEISGNLISTGNTNVFQLNLKQVRHVPAVQDTPLFKSAVESVNECIFITDLSGHILFVNKAFEETYGYTRGEIQGTSISILQQDQDQLGFTTQFDKCDHLEDWGGELNHYKKNGTKFPVSLSSSVIKNELNEPFALINISKDISNQKQLEEELVKAEKLESLGILAGGIAHDFNNLLTSVIGNLSLGKSLIDGSTKLATILDRTEESAVKASRLTSQLLTFSRGGEPIRERITVKKMVDEALEFSLSGSKVEAQVDMRENIFPVFVDKALIGQAFQNIIVNAMHAMSRGGTIRVNAINMTIDSTNRISGLEGRYYVRVDFTDTGIGIAANNLDKIFDPFFSTKQHSSGLGLATAYSIVKKHGGAITVDSVEGKGSAFSVYLPAVIETEEPVESENRPIGALEGGKILVMDDEQSIREVCSQMLEYIGYEVSTVEDGSQAIESYLKAMQQGESFDVVIMDLTIPGGMGGEEAIKELRRIDKNVTAIVSSGYSTSPVMANYHEYGFTGVISKPYQIDDLRKTLREIVWSD